MSNSSSTSSRFSVVVGFQFLFYFFQLRTPDITNHKEEERQKAFVYERYGSPDVLHLQDVAKPVPTDDEVLVKNSCRLAQRV